MPIEIKDAGRVRREVLEQILTEPGNAVERLDKLVACGRAPKHIVLELLSRLTNQ